MILLSSLKKIIKEIRNIVISNHYIYSCCKRVQQGIATPKNMRNQKTKPHRVLLNEKLKEKSK